MRLFSVPSGAIGDQARSQWLTPPFDLALASPAPYVSRYLPPTPYTGPLCVSWALGAVETTDSDAFWATVCRNGSGAGPSLASLLDVRPRPAATPVTAASLPSAVNPLAFLCANVLRGQCEVVRINAISVGPGRLDGLAGVALRRVVPPHALLLAQLLMPEIVDNQAVPADRGGPATPDASTPPLINASGGWAPPASDRPYVETAPAWNY